MDLQQITDRVWVIRGAVNMGLVSTSAGLVAVDTGLDKQAGKNVMKAAAELGLPLTAIVNTHAHADHYGGNATILARTEVPVYAPVSEAAVIRCPFFEPEYLWNGAQPLAELRNKFLLADPSQVDFEFSEASGLTVEGVEFQVKALPGHARGQVGVLAHGALFAADAYFDASVTDKHGIPFMVHYQETLDSAAKVLDVAADWVVPGHGEPTQDPSEAIAHLRQTHERVFEQVVRVVGAGACSLEDVVAELCQSMDLKPNSPGAYVLLRTPVAAYLTAASEAGLIHPVLESGRLLFVKS